MLCRYDKYLFAIKVKTPYPDNYDKCLDCAADEKADDARLQLTEQVANRSDYHTVFLRFPRR